MISKWKYQTFFAVIAIIALLLGLTACTGKHKHTYAEQFSYDAENHWRSAICEHKEQKQDSGAHQMEDGTCKTCGYLSVALQVKTENENQKYVRTESIYSMLKLGFAYGNNTADVKWVQAKQSNIESYLISNGEIAVTVSAMADNIKYTKEIKLPLNETPIDVETFFTQDEGANCMLSGIVAGFASVGTHNEVVLSDKQTGRLVTVRKLGEGKLLYGGYCLPGIEIGDEIIVPVTLVKEKQSADTANSAKVYAEYAGGTEYKAAVVSQKNTVKYPAETVVIDSQKALETFMAAGNRENNHYKIVEFKGKMNFVMDVGYENYNFWFDGHEVNGKGNVQIDKITPCFNDPAVSYTNGVSFSELVFGKPHLAGIDYKNPMSAEVNITAVFLGGSTTFGQFLILDQSWVVK